MFSRWTLKCSALSWRFCRLYRFKYLPLTGLPFLLFIKLILKGEIKNNKCVELTDLSLLVILSFLNFWLQYQFKKKPSGNLILYCIVVVLLWLDLLFFSISQISRFNLITLESVEWCQLNFLAILRVKNPSLGKAIITQFFWCISRLYGTIICFIENSNIINQIFRQRSEWCNISDLLYDAIKTRNNIIQYFSIIM